MKDRRKLTSGGDDLNLNIEESRKMGTAFEDTVRIKSQTCCACGVVFAMPEELERKRREDQKPFSCPNGHSQSFTESLADQLQRQVDAKQRTIQSLTSDIGSLNKKLKASERRNKKLSGKRKKK